jgi:hypothetical protein
LVLYIVESTILHCCVYEKQIEIQNKHVAYKHVNVRNFSRDIACSGRLFRYHVLLTCIMEAVYGVRIEFEKPRYYARYCTLYMLNMYWKCLLKLFCTTLFHSKVARCIAIF